MLQKSENARIEKVLLILVIKYICWKKSFYDERIMSFTNFYF